ncbi:MAG: uroporphyrinogen decarboxylase family protein [Planctomycetota bacterium]|jgi:hypothetical protein
MGITRVNFASSYWYRNTDYKFSYESLSDPAVQIDHRTNSHHHILDKWESLGVHVDADTRNSINDALPMINGYGVATISMIFGCKGVFTDDLDPYADPLDLDDEAIMNLKPIEDLSDNPVMQDLEAQADWMKKKYGKVRTSINMQSVPNIAFKVRGDQLMFDFYDNPELVHKLVDYVQQSWINIRSYISRLNERNGCPDGEGGFINLDNCTVALISPDIYREFFLPYDVKTAQHYNNNYGVHHCGANMHLFAEDYAKLGDGVWFDIGYGSDVKASMELLQTTEERPLWSVRYGPAKLRSAEPEEIKEEVKALEACGADTISCVGTDPDTPEENLKAFLVG